MKTSAIISIFSAAMAFASAIPQASNLPKVVSAPIDGYEIAPMKWTGQVDKRSENITLEGTLEEITVKAREINPDFGASPSVEKRGFGKINCGWGGKGRAGVLAIKEGIDYLQGINGYCGLDDGPYKCARVSCSWDSAIWLCNDNDTPLRVPCKDLGPFAAKIREDCMSSGWSEPMTQGQLFSDEGNWNVIVGKDSC
ncbi:hypothetical protein CEP54_003648 [Fusarium duplospermum]|uniref:Uncharacterized protein n=1 Tax=Fusarium duplospermum TaxID=1325734 RepID=A0A428QMK8_9HYPO|nr:hypothetical protein CEP54_003648 [Fusarium duplospermum]